MAAAVVVGHIRETLLAFRLVFLSIELIIGHIPDSERVHVKFFIFIIIEDEKLLKDVEKVQIFWIHVSESVTVPPDSVKFSLKVLLTLKR